MNFELKSYVLWALCEEENSNNPNKIHIGESPYFHAFYENLIGRQVDADEEDLADIPEIRAYFEDYKLSKEQLESIESLSLIGAWSVNEMLIDPFEDDTKVRSLEGIEALVNLKGLDLDLFRGDSLEPLAQLKHLSCISNLPLNCDYSPLLNLPNLTRIHVSGYVKTKDFGKNPQVLEQLKEKGVKVEGNLTIEQGRFGFAS